jgi:hypothetical protein
MININGLRKFINKRTKLYQLYDKNIEQFTTVVRREGIILADHEWQHKGSFFRETSYYHSGYICTVTMENGQAVNNSIKCYEYFTNTEIKQKLFDLGLIDNEQKIIHEIM